jgi:hypothetical protein
VAKAGLGFRMTRIPVYYYLRRIYRSKRTPAWRLQLVPFFHSATRTVSLHKILFFTLFKLQLHWSLQPLTYPSFLFFLIAGCSCQHLVVCSIVDQRVVTDCSLIDPPSWLHHVFPHFINPSFSTCSEL